ncbi:ribosomal protein L11 methyltransferase [Sphingobium sp. SYK-6]|uniref:50S ribosomal protein L11 methyltransferase n=1 Tax=Sphingobium sp. (strain NBRC 103272 / SYK-6) TaxID=627192 RepID=UPI0002277187|nr:50S ribosomal protein L11 methyltransferase [Sphingobium sp. SYK-6]BAK65866.1 ribosomal protein L11 methyltransferase [Sphingobium sp. SYK-6]
MKKPASTGTTDPASPAWQMSFPCTRALCEQLQDEADMLFAGWPSPPALVASEPDETRPDDWLLDIIFPHKPDDATIATVLARLPEGTATPYRLEPVPDADWVTQSQAGLEPITAGRFHVRNDGEDAAPPGFTDFLIPASRAFGTGQHETTRGCLDVLSRLGETGHRFGNIADIGTGTGLLAFAALSLWPRAHVLASDIDPVAVAVSAENAALNGVPLGGGAGEVQLVAAPGVDHDLIVGLAPYDLIIANILAGPLIELAPSLVAQLAGGGTLVIAGLLKTQADRVTAAYRAQGMLLMERADHGDWPTLRLRKRHRFGWRRPLHWRREDFGDAPGYGSW